MRISDWSSDVCSSDLFQNQSLIQQQEPFGLTDIFSFNLGPEHLKTFKDGDAVKPATTQKQLSAVPSIPVFPFSAPIEKALILSGAHTVRCSPDRKNFISRRGPPAI